jgi:hypothetical protein
MPGPAPMKIFFAIADANGDGGLSFDEVTAIHKRIFDRVNANKDGEATPRKSKPLCGSSRVPAGTKKTSRLTG